MNIPVWGPALWATAALLGQTPVLPMDGAFLRKIPGPIAESRQFQDQALGPEVSRMEASIRRSARRGVTLPGVRVPPGDVAITHAVAQPAGWMAYQVEAEPGGTVKARLRGEHEAWFRMFVVNKFGQLEKGMLQNMAKRGNPEASYINPGAQAATVYFVVDTTTPFNGDEPYVISFTREGTPAKP